MTVPVMVALPGPVGEESWQEGASRRAAIAHETRETVRRIGERENMRPSLAWPRTIKTVYGDDTFPPVTSPVPERTNY
jgi:hypothetical protein